MQYAYVHARPDTVSATGIFYVGKGTARRASNVARRNPHHTNIVAKHGAENILVGMIPCSSEAIAFDLERGLIKCLRRMGVKLTNMTDGGEGNSNPSQETRSKIAAALRGTKASAETREKLSSVNKKRMENPAAREASKSFTGRKHTAVSIAKMSAAKSGKPFSDLHKVALSAAKKGKTLSPVHAEKIRQAAAKRKGVPIPEERRRKIAAVLGDTEHRRAVSIRTSGTIWVNDGAYNKRVAPNAIPVGFKRGKKASRKAQLN